MIPTGKETAWIASWGNDTMLMYDTQGTTIRSVTVAKHTRIWDIAVKQSDDVIVCNRDNKVRLMTVTGEVSTLIDSEPYSPQGVCLTEREEIMLCMAGRSDENHVALFSSNGKKKIRKIAVKSSKGKQLLTDPYRVVVNAGNISVMNWMSNVVTCEKDGKARWVYDGTQAKMGKLDARGMCKDKFRNLLISDHDNHCVHYVDREGGLIQILLSYTQHQIEQPLGIGVDAVTGNVWVGLDRRKLGYLNIYRTN